MIGNLKAEADHVGAQVNVLPSPQQVGSFTTAFFGRFVATRASEKVPRNFALEHYFKD